MRRELPEWWGTTGTGSRAHLIAERGAGDWALALCGQGGVSVKHAIGSRFPLPIEPWCQTCRAVAESAAERVQADLRYLGKIGVL